MAIGIVFYFAYGTAAAACARPAQGFRKFKERSNAIDSDGARRVAQPRAEASCPGAARRTSVQRSLVQYDAQMERRPPDVVGFCKIGWAWGER